MCSNCDYDWEPDFDSQVEEERLVVLDQQNLCVCEQPGHFNSGVPGVLAHLENGKLAGRVERCDQCKRYDTDQDARYAFFSAYNNPLFYGHNKEAA